MWSVGKLTAYDLKLALQEWGIVTCTREVTLLTRWIFLCVCKHELKHLRTDFDESFEIDGFWGRKR